MTKLAQGNPKKIERKRTIAALRSKGKSMAEIAKAVNVAKSTVWQDLQDAEVKAILDETTKYYATFAPLVREEQIKLITHEDPGVKQKAISEYHKVMGLSGSQVSIAVQNLYATQNNVVLPDHLQRLLAQGMGDVIDVTPYEDTTKAAPGK